MRKTLCHAAALAWVGWYLMILPRDHPELPVERWAHVDSFDSADACRAAGYEYQQRAAASADPVKMKEAGNWKCIATDDPRLAK